VIFFLVRYIVAQIYHLNNKMQKKIYIYKENIIYTFIRREMCYFICIPFVNELKIQQKVSYNKSIKIDIL